MRKILLSLMAAATLGLAAPQTEASSGAPVPPAQEWSFQGFFGTYDRDALRRGLQVYREVCSSCHGLSLVSYRHLGNVGFSEDEVKAIAGEYEVEDGPNDEGEMFMRAAIPADRFVKPFPNTKAAQAANNGALPPDLSLIVKARKHGPDYLYALLTGYKDEAPEGVHISDGQYYNEFFPGHAISMAPPVDDESVEYADGTEATKAQIAKDVTTFLAWTASPELEERKRMGVKVMIFLIVLTVLMYALKRKIWSDVKH